MKPLRMKLRHQIFDTLITINKEDDESIYNILDLFLSEGTYNAICKQSYKLFQDRCQ